MRHVLSAGVALAYDLEHDPAIFDGQGDRQFDVYRAMRVAVEQDWDNTALQTNALWLDYLVDKLLTEKTYKSRAKREAKVRGSGTRAAALPCAVLCCAALPCPVLCCAVLPCPALPCPALPCPALPCAVSFVRGLGQASARSISRRGGKLAVGPGWRGLASR